MERSAPAGSCMNCRERDSGSGWVIGTVIANGSGHFVPQARSGGKLCRNCAIKEAKRQNAALAVLAHAKAAANG
jgi:hypothetical protein